MTRPAPLPRVDLPCRWKPPLPTATCRTCGSVEVVIAGLGAVLAAHNEAGMGVGHLCGDKGVYWPEVEAWRLTRR